ncbi:hypothetical protein BDA96_02G136500 [Sorghum bicolor]|uniref:Uncharacterized protein n=2 Tax=Sorghum bicolor TaxID=4558 RepID=A0A921UTJ7_SORBI|nr:hypothetical protein BDA96_02G136500 [Sorghum bicolor]KXG35080.1 hypothetical protein SORBI_3002G129900 [Sorghum bicolor]
MRVEMMHRRKLPVFGSRAPPTGLMTPPSNTGNSKRLGHNSGSTCSWASEGGAEVTYLPESKRVAERMRASESKRVELGRKRANVICLGARGDGRRVNG